MKPHQEMHHEVDPDPGYRSPIAIKLVVTLLMLSSATVILVYYLTVGDDKLLQQLFRFLITAGLCWKLLEGRPWARWVTVALTGFGLLAAFEFLMDYGFLNPFTGVVAVYATIVLLLLLGPGVERHFSPHREDFLEDDWE